MAEGRSFTADQESDAGSLECRAAGLFLGGSRSLLYSQVAIELLRRQLFHQLGEELARAILAQAGRHAGFNDAQLLLQTQSFESIERMLEAQYGLLARSGFGRFAVLNLAWDAASREIYLRVRCEASPEAESHRRLFGRATAPACCHLVGYSSGWSSAVVGVPVLTVETHCLAKGDDHCEFETMPYADFVGPEASFWKRSFESTSVSLAQQLKEQLQTIQTQMETITAQQADIAQLSSPVLQIQSGVLVLPVIGNVDQDRATTMAETLLNEIVRCRASGVIIDLTGATNLDTVSAGYLIRMVRSVKLLGSRAVLTGISPATSQLLVAEGFDVGETPTQRTLQDGVRYLERLPR